MADPKETPFYKAMQLCDGVVVVLDGNATPFLRIWCCFELAMVILGKKLLLDFATVHDDKPQLLTEGFASPEEENNPQQKSNREYRFPLELMEKGYDIRIEEAEASQEKDKRSILNSIAKKPLDVINPATEAVAGVISLGSEADVDKAVRAARTPCL